VAGSGRPVNARQTADGRDEMTLDGIRETWGEVYQVGYAEGVYLARRVTGGPWLPAGSPEALASVIRADWARWSAR